VGADDHAARSGNGFGVCGGNGRGDEGEAKSREKDAHGPTVTHGRAVGKRFVAHTPRLGALLSGRGAHVALPPRLRCLARFSDLAFLGGEQQAVDNLRQVVAHGGARARRIAGA
jgi:hypothetical protein